RRPPGAVHHPPRGVGAGDPGGRRGRTRRGARPSVRRSVVSASARGGCGGQPGRGPALRRARGWALSSTLTSFKSSSTDLLTAAGVEEFSALTDEIVALRRSASAKPDERLEGMNPDDDDRDEQG